MQYEHTQLQPTEICTQAWKRRSRFGRQMRRESLELEVALRPDVVRLQELGQAVDLARPEGDVHEREALEDLLLQGLRPAPSHSDDPARILGLEALRLAEVADQPVVGRLPDRAGVEEDQVGAVALGGLLEAERLEHALHPLGVVLVHLTAEGGDVVRLHGFSGYLAHELRHNPTNEDLDAGVETFSPM